MSKFSYAEWEATQVRLTVFPTPDNEIREPGWWHQVTGEEPTQHTEDKKRRSSVISGELEPGALTLVLAPERIDWTLSAPGIDPARAFSPMAAMTVVFNKFSILAERWLTAPDVPAITRIAFGAVVTHAESDRDSAYRRLPDYVPINVDPSWRDFMLQINIPRNIIGQDDQGPKHINRLSRWSVQGYYTGLLIPGGEGLIGAPHSNKHALRLEMDLNTAGEYQETIPRHQVVPLFQTLVEAATEIASDGIKHEQYKL